MRIGWKSWIGLVKIGDWDFECSRFIVERLRDRIWVIVVIMGYEEVMSCEGGFASFWMSKGSWIDSKEGRL